MAQEPLSQHESNARTRVEEFLQEVLDKGGEGIVLRDPKAPWTPKRAGSLLKYKPYHDAEAQIVGFVSGNEGKQGIVLGKIGALIVNFQGTEFEIGSGLTMQQRELAENDWANSNPGKRIPNPKAQHFRVGDVITFKYRELSDDGVPKEARYWRAA